LDTTLLQAARHASAREEKPGGGNAGYTVTPGQAHYGYKAHVAVDETHTLRANIILLW
jgi:hypothetical protein